MQTTRTLLKEEFIEICLQFVPDNEFKQKIAKKKITEELNNLLKALNV